MSEMKWICPECGSEHSMDALFCAVCGTKRPEQGQKEKKHDEPLAFCPKCGAKIAADAVFCGNCGAKIADFAEQQEEHSETEPEEELEISSFEEEYQEEPQPSSDQIEVSDSESDERYFVDLRNDDQKVILTADEAENGCRLNLVLPDGEDAFLDLPGSIKDGSKLKLNNIENADGTCEDIYLDIVIE